jgi:8-oxo-dGTP pyrophosphatase MutT (NUDIX family)
MSEPTEVHFEGKIAQKAIIVKENMVLLVRDPRMDEVIWEIPGGRMNIDEEPREAVAREIREELGIEINVGPVLHMEQFIQGNEGKRAFVIVYKCHMTHPSAEVTMNETEVCEIAWVSADELSEYPLFPEYKRALDYYFANQG